MSDAIQEALARRKILEDQIAEIDTFLALHEKIFGVKIPREAEGAPAEGLTPETPRKRAPRASNDPEAIVNEIAKILEDTDTPMTRGEIRRAISARGMEIHSKDIGKYLGTLMWRNQDRFINIEGEGYWLKNRILPDHLSEKDELFQ